MNSFFFFNYRIINYNYHIILLLDIIAKLQIYQTANIQVYIFQYPGVDKITYIPGQDCKHIMENENNVNMNGRPNKAYTDRGSKCTGDWE